MQVSTDYEKLIFKVSHQFKNSILPKDNSLSFEDLVQEGWECYLELLQEQKEEELKWPFGVALFNKIEQRFIDMVRYLGRKKRTAETTPISKWEFYDEYLRNETLPIELIQETSKYLFLSEEAKEVVDILRNSPKELIEIAKELSLPKAISKYLFEYKGWEIPKIKLFWESL